MFKEEQQQQPLVSVKQEKFGSDDEEADTTTTGADDGMDVMSYYDIRDPVVVPYIKKEELERARFAVPQLLTFPHAQPKKAKKTATLEEAATQFSSLRKQNIEMERYNECNHVNTEAVKESMDRLVNYCYALFKDGQCTTKLLEMCDNVSQDVTKWNMTVATQQNNMEDYVRNMVAYNAELHELHSSMQRSDNNNRRKNPASPFNTVQVGIETIPISNENKAIKSSMF